MSAQTPCAKPPGKSNALKRVVVASMAGTVVEWYEFFLYTSAATLVFNLIFFPQTDEPLDGVIAAFVTYAVGFVARPLGGIVFGYFGDRYGRKHLLQVAIIMVGASTFLMGCLPTFQSIGYWAPALLVTLRFFQGFAVGGEWGGAVLLVAEHAPKQSRGFWASWPQAALPLGNLLATIVLWVLSWTLTVEQFLAWGWRIGFWLSVVIVAVGYYVRTKVSDAPIFTESQAIEIVAEKRTNGLVEVFRHYPRQVFTAMGLRFAENVMYYLVVTFSITYLSIHLGVETTPILSFLLLAHVVQFFVIPQIGRLADRYGRRIVYGLGALLSATWGFFAFPMFDTKNTFFIVTAIVIGLVLHGMMYAGQPAIMAEMFPTRMRYSGVSLGYQVTSIVAGSIAPIIAAELLKRTGSSVPVAIYLAIGCAITLIAVLSLPETKGLDLNELDRVDRTRLE